jgi:hypothetical protein
MRDPEHIYVCALYSATALQSCLVLYFCVPSAQPLLLRKRQHGRLDADLLQHVAILPLDVLQQVGLQGLGLEGGPVLVVP